MTDECIRRVTTHIPGLDVILEGGFLAGGVYIIEGPPGGGKTTLGSQFCFGHAGAGGRALYVTMLAEQHTRLLGHLRRMHFFDASLVPDRVSYVSAFKVLESEGLGSVLKTVRQTISEQNITAIVLDGLTSAEEASPSANDFKKFIHELQIITSMTGCTALLLNSSERPGGFRPERTMVDGILELQDDLVGQHGVRHLIARKMRGAAQVRGRHFMEITDAGVRVIPRIEAARPPMLSSQLGTPGPGRATFDVPELDAMLCGGLPQSSMTALVGPSGSGKTVLGLHFLKAALAHQEKALYFGFFERPAAILEKARRLQMGLAEAVESKQLELHWQRPIEGVIDLLADRMLQAVRRSGTKRVFIDGLQGFQAAAGNTERLREVMSCVTDELESLGVTSVYSSETPDLFGDQLQLSILGMSSLTHNIILLRHLERECRTVRRISVLKLRDSDHDQSVREFSIADDGIRLAALPPSRRNAEEGAPGRTANNKHSKNAAPEKRTNKRA